MMSNQSAASGVAVLKREAGQFKLQRVIPIQGGPAGLVLTHDGKVLVVAAGKAIVMLDTARMISGAADPILANFADGPRAGSIYVNITANDKLLFVSDENAQTISVIDLNHVRTSGFENAAIIGKIPVGIAPIALTFSPDGRWLYTTSEIAPSDWGWPSTFNPERADPDQPNALVPAGAVVVVDIAKAATDPAHCVVARVPAGASPVRMTISPNGQRIYVTARGSNAVLVFDAAKLVTDSQHAQLASVAVGASPVPLALIQGGKLLVVGNSNRFSADAAAPQTLSVLDVTRIGQSDAVICAIATGAFPREMCLSSDGQLLFVTNFGSNALQIIDAQNPPIDRK